MTPQKHCCIIKQLFHVCSSSLLVITKLEGLVKGKETHIRFHGMVQHDEKQGTKEGQSGIKVKQP